MRVFAGINTSRKSGSKHHVLEFSVYLFLKASIVTASLRIMFHTVTLRFVLFHWTLE